jgi:hypothetical protein
MDFPGPRRISTVTSHTTDWPRNRTLSETQPANAVLKKKASSLGATADAEPPENPIGSATKAFCLG